jgi:hypothetical protein
MFRFLLNLLLIASTGLTVAGTFMLAQWLSAYGPPWVRGPYGNTLGVGTAFALVSLAVAEIFAAVCIWWHIVGNKR